MSLRDYVLIVARNWIIVAVTVAIGLATAGILAVTATTRYTASAEVLFTGHASTSGQDLAYAGNYVQQRMQTYKNLGGSTGLLTAVATSLGSSDTPRDLADRTDIEVSQLNTVATISATDTTAEGSSRTANTLALALLEAVQELEADDPLAAVDDEPPNTTIEGVVTGEAEVPTSPSGPDVLLHLLVGLVVGLVVSLGVVAVREVLRSGAGSTPAGESPDG